MKTKSEVIGLQVNEFAEQARRATNSKMCVLLCVADGESFIGLTHPNRMELPRKELALANVQLITGLCRCAQYVGAGCANDVSVVLHVDDIVYKDWGDVAVETIFESDE